jgi:tetratricopeptide (TPR) repeat protein
MFQGTGILHRLNPVPPGAWVPEQFLPLVSICARLEADMADFVDLSLPRDRTMSVGSTAALSIAPTGTLSNSRAPSRPPSPPMAGSDHGRTPTESRILSGLWLQSAATYRRWGKVDQCLVSIQEAEIIDPENPDVWVQLGLLHRVTSPHSPHLAISAFTKSVLLRTDYSPSVVSLSKIYLETGQVELAHNMLFQLTQGGGWDVPEAWYYLGKSCQEQGRLEKAKECWQYALELEKTRPCRTWAEAVDRWL